MKAAVDYDILLYEIGFGAEAYWKAISKEKETILPPPFALAEEMLESRMANILAIAGADSSPIICLTSKTNFRSNIAKSFVYKKRKSKRPYHYKNLLAYAKCRWECHEEEGLEADDLLSLHITEDKNLIACSRDKDLLQVEGWHYQWECGKQPQLGPFLVSGYGEIYLDDKRKLRGWGLKFFLAQCLMGDPVDTIPGLPFNSSVAAFKCIGGTETYAEGLEAVREAYRASERDDAYLLEQGQILWMTRKKNLDGSPELWSLEYEPESK